MRALVAFLAGVVSATVACVLAAEVWLHMIEHTAYTKAAR